MKYLPGEIVLWQGFEAVVLGPTDEEGTHYDIVEAYFGTQTVPEDELEPTHETEHVPKAAHYPPKPFR